MKRVTGIGGILFKTKEPQKMKEWYNKHLGLNAGDYGATFEWRNSDDDKKGQTVWNPFKEESKYFAPSEKQFMINYRVDNLEALLAELKKEGIEPVGEMQSYDFGKFAHIMDPDGNKIELWEPAGE